MNGPLFWQTGCEAEGILNQEADAMTLNRRTFLLAGAALAAASATAQEPRSIPIIDTHIHLFDPRRPQGAPYTGPEGHSPQVALPDRYRALAAPLGIVGAIEVEASPWIEDNLWVLEVAQPATIMVATVGNLRPEHPDFPEYLERFHKNPLYRGIRCGNLWNYDFVGQVENEKFIDGLKLLARAGLVLDTANPTIDLLQAIVRVSDRVPDLRIVLDHLPSLEPTPETRDAYEAVLSELQKRPNIVAKLSAVIHRVNGTIATDLNTHRARLDHLTEIFGEDRVLFGSDWPNSDGSARLDQVVSIVREYFASKPQLVAEKYFWRNSARVYKWIKRQPDQPTLA
jgi:L-fuconolactonase